MTSGRAVLSYETYTVDIHFVPGEARCIYCPLLENYRRFQCRRTGEYIVDERGRGRDCPLRRKEDAEHGDPRADFG